LDRASKKYASDKSLDRGIGISSAGDVDLRNKKYDTERYRTRNSVASQDKTDELDYARERMPSYNSKRYTSKPAAKKYETPYQAKYDAPAEYKATAKYNTPVEYKATAKYDAPAEYKATAKYDTPAYLAQDDIGSDGILIDNLNGNKNVNSEKSKQENKAASANANTQTQEKSRKKLNYKERNGGYERGYGGGAYRRRH
jgi:hypothetical protein